MYFEVLMSMLGHTGGTINDEEDSIQMGNRERISTIGRDIRGVTQAVSEDKDLMLEIPKLLLTSGDHPRLGVLTQVKGKQLYSSCTVIKDSITDLKFESSFNKIKIGKFLSN